MTMRWTPGGNRALVWETGMALLDGQVSDEQAERIWLSQSREPRLGSFLQVLMETTGTGLLTIPSFAVAILSDDAHVAVRGPLQIRIAAAGGQVTVSGEEVTTWEEKIVSGPATVELTAPEAGGRSLPLIAGLVDASRLIWEAPSEQPMLAPSPESAVPEPEPDPKAHHAAPVSELSEPTKAQDRDESPAMSVPTPDVPEPTEPGEEPESAEADDVPDPTQVRPADEVEVPEAAAESWSAGPGEPVIRPEQIPTLMPDPTHDPQPLVEVESAVPQRREELRHGETVADEQAEVSITVKPVRNGIEVLAAFCENNHPNPLQRVTCYICDKPVGGQPRQVIRPQLGWLRISGGEKVPLLGPVVAGRNPQSRAISAETTPRLVALPHSHVSSTHIAFLLEGWTVLARDLGSRNGSYLRRHGKPPMRMPEQDVPLVPGDVIDLGHGVFINLERIP